MARRVFALSFVVASSLAVLGGCSETGPSINDVNRLVGGTTLVEGKAVSTWADVDFLGNVSRVGVTMDADLVANPPTEPGTGPLGAVAVLPFPEAIRNVTVFNHFELHWNMAGHEPNHIYGVPHFDLHSYFIPEGEVRAIAPPDSVAPNANRVPEGYTYPGVGAAVPMMGVHASPNSDFAPGFEFEKTMILGYWGGNMIFLEPMITQAFLQAKQGYSIQMPVPEVLGRNANYPTRFSATFDAARNVWDFVYSDFVIKS
ncbi:MAG: hypothetical protein ACAH95_18270 [Fimbriimonas sp.]